MIWFHLILLLTTTILSILYANHTIGIRAIYNYDLKPTGNCGCSKHFKQQFWKYHPIKNRDLLFKWGYNFVKFYFIIVTEKYIKNMKKGNRL